MHYSCVWRETNNAGDVNDVGDAGPAGDAGALAMLAMLTMMAIMCVMLALMVLRCKFDDVMLALIVMPTNMVMLALAGE